MRPKLTAIILNYKNQKDTLACLKSLQDSDGGGEIDYLIVDNSADNVSAKELSDNAPGIPLIKNEANLGFAGGNNIGIQKALSRGSQYILIVNPDVRVNKHFFKPLLSRFGDKKVGLVAPAIKHTQKNKTVYGLEGKVDWNLAKPTHRNISTLKSTKPIPSEFVTFACIIIKAAVFRKIGFLDERYFMYFEDVDFCLTAGENGFKIVLDPSVLVSHRTSGSFRHPTGKLAISFSSHLKFIFKWLHFPNNIRPFFYVLTLYPYLYLLWTYHSLKYRSP